MKAITGATLIDGTGSAPVPDAVVLIEGSDIAGHGQRRIGAGPGRSRTDRSSGHDADARPDRYARPPGVVQLRDRQQVGDHGAAQHAPPAHRVCAASDARDRIHGSEGRRRTGRGIPDGRGRRVWCRGRACTARLGFITPTGGMADSVSPLGYRAPSGEDSGLPWGVADGPEAMRAKVREMVGAGADVIKTATTGGASSGAGLGPKDVLFERDELEALVDEAHKRGRRVMCHALGGARTPDSNRGGRGLHRARIVPRRRPGAAADDGGEGHLLHADLWGVHVPRDTGHSARQGARRRAARAPRQERADGARARRHCDRGHRRGRLGARQQRPRDKLPRRGRDDSDAGHRRRDRATPPAAWAWETEIGSIEVRQEGRHHPRRRQPASMT